MERFAGRCVLIAGGATGIGAATALRLAEEGASKIVIGDIRHDLAAETIGRVKALGGDGLAVQYDQRQEESIVNLVRVATDFCGEIAGFFGNAADIDSSKSPYSIDADIATMNAGAWLDTYKVNTVGLAVAVRELLPHMIAHGKGAMVLTASDSAFRPFLRWTAYSSSKAGLSTIARHICLAHGKQGIRANVVSPGLIASESYRQLLESERSAGISGGATEIAATVNCPRLGEPRDIAAAVAYFLSDDAEYVNGQILNINGGNFSRP